MGKELLDSKKDLLLKDLCARLPYGVKVHFLGWDSEYLQQKKMVDTLYSIDSDGYCNTDDYDSLLKLESIKPYLFPLSDMVKEVIIVEGNRHIATNIDWLNANHIDYRGLIEKGLAIDATGLNIY